MILSWKEEYKKCSAFFWIFVHPDVTSIRKGSVCPVMDIFDISHFKNFSYGFDLWKSPKKKIGDK